MDSRTIGGALAAQQEDEFKRYQRTWYAVAVAPSALAFLLSMTGFGGYPYWFLFDPVHTLLVLSPIVAWSLARRGLRRTQTPPGAPDEGPTPEESLPHRGAPSAQQGAYRMALQPDDGRLPTPSGDLRPQTWWVTGPFPRWTAGMLFLSLILNALWYGLYLLSLASLPYSREISPVPFWLMIPRLCLLGLWWYMCRADASDVGVLERTTEEDGSRRWVLRTIDRRCPAWIERVDSDSREIHLEAAGSRDVEVWATVGPVDDIVHADRTLDAT
jgi:hypothetical protein